MTGDTSSKVLPRALGLRIPPRSQTDWSYPHPSHVIIQARDSLSVDIASLLGIIKSIVRCNHVIFFIPTDVLSITSEADPSSSRWPLRPFAADNSPSSDNMELIPCWRPF